MSTEPEKVEMEAVPLKTDTDEKPAEETTKKEVPKKTWFFQKDKKKAAAAVEGEEKAPEEEKKKEKKPCFWSRCSAKKAEGEEAEKQMSCGVDMTVRDEKALNDHVKISFEDIFGEPDTAHAWDCTWRATNTVFNGTRCFFYKLFSFLIFLPAAFIFAFFIALFTAFNNYIATPFAKLVTIPVSWFTLTWAFLVRTLLDPLFRSCGLCLSGVSVRKYGLNNAPTDLINA